MTAHVGKRTAAARKRVARFVAARLSELDRPADLVREDGLESLFQQADGSEDRLRALLSSALFIASTEDSAQVGAEHVLRAAALLDPAVAEQPVEAEAGESRWIEPVAALETATPVPDGGRPGLMIGAAAALILCVIAGVQFAARRPPVPVAQAPVPAEVIASKQVAAPVSPHPTGLSPTTPTMTAPAAESIGLSDVPLPVQPPAAVIIRTVSGDPGASGLVQSMATRLEAAGMHPAFALVARGKPTQPSISYFYDEDRPAAMAAAAAAGPGILPPRLMTPIDGRTLRPPGTIEILVP